MKEAGLWAALTLSSSHAGLKQLVRYHFAARVLLKPTIRVRKPPCRVRTLIWQHLQRPLQQTRSRSQDLAKLWHAPRLSKAHNTALDVEQKPQVAY
jgi:hypothetical protein